jgi:predicted metal-dependent phosphoesterase TrpH
MGKADLHIHTDVCDGIDSVEQILEYVEHKTDLDVIAITEHDRLRVSHRARELMAKRNYRFEVVSGVEISTLDGHLVALFIEEPIPSKRPIEETIEAVRRQGGLCFIPHPLSPIVKSISTAAVERVTAANLSFDGIELSCSSPFTRLYVARARRLNDNSCQLPCIGASDAHFVQAIGTGYTQFEGSSGEDLRKAINECTVTGGETPYPALTQIGLRRTLSAITAALRAKASDERD